MLSEVKTDQIIHKIREIFGKPEGMIPLHAPVFIGNEKKYLDECIESTFVSSVGQFVEEFEVKIALYTGAKKAVVCMNGTNALYLALKMAGVTAGSEVLTQPLTFIATANSIAYCEAHPVFLDVDLDTMGMSAKGLAEFLEKETFQQPDGCYNRQSKRKITACVPMHTYGHPCRIDEIVEICDKYHIPVVEDAAESIGSLYKGKQTGTFGRIGVLSFNGNKILTTGGGGMLLFNDEDLAKKAKHLTTQAKVEHPWEFIHDDIGYNYRMPNINAALGLAQLEQLDVFIERKRALADIYAEFFRSLEIQFFTEPDMARSNYWLNVLLLNDSVERNEFLEKTNNNNIKTRPAWKLMSDLPMFTGCQKTSLANATFLQDRLVNIPSSVIIK